MQYLAAAAESMTGRVVIELSRSAEKLNTRAVILFYEMSTDSIMSCEAFLGYLCIQIRERTIQSWSALWLEIRRHSVFGLSAYLTEYGRVGMCGARKSYAEQRQALDVAKEG